MATWGNVLDFSLQIAEWVERDEEINRMSFKKKVPGPRSLPIVGDYPRFVKDPLLYLRNIASQYGPVAKFNLAGFEFVLLSQPELVEFVFKNDNEKFGKSKAAKTLSPLLGNGLLLSEGDLWRKQRKLAAPSFHRSQLAHMVPQVSELCERYFDELEEGPQGLVEIPLRPTTADIALHVLSRFFMTGGLHNAPEDIYETTKDLIDGFGKRGSKGLSSPLWFPTELNRGINRGLSKFNTYAMELIKSIRNNPDEENLMSRMLKARDEYNKTMSDKQARDELATIFFAGHETTASTLCWVLYNLNHHPEVYKKVTDELEEVLQGRRLTIKDIPSLKYLVMVIEETLRLYPPGYLLRRTALEDVKLGDFLLPKGTMVMVSQWVSHRHPDNWEEPNVFKPERMSFQKKKEQHSFSYFPFGGGKRTCIGNNFAMLELVSIVATLLQNHEIVPNPEMVAKPKVGVTLYPDREIFLKLKRR